MLTAALMIVQQIGAKTTRDTLFLSNHPASELPAVMIGAALLSLAGALTFSRLLKRFGPARALPLACLLHASAFFAEWYFVARAPALVSVLLYLHVGAVSPVVISGFWSLVNEQFDPHTAKRLVSRIAASAAFGGVLGGVLSERLIAGFGLLAMLPTLAGVTGLTAIMASRMGGAVASTTNNEPTTDSVQALGSVRYLRDVATLVLVTSTSAGLLDYVLKAEAADAFSEPGSLGSFFAVFHAALSVLVFIVQSALSNRSLQRLGLGGTIALLPAGILLGGVLGVAITRLWTVALVNGLENTLRNSLFRSGYELLYTPVDRARKRAVKTLIDVGFDRLGDIVAAALAMLALALFSEEANRLALGLVMVVAALSLGLSLRLHRGYIDELARNLRSGTLNVKDVRDLDATTRRTLTDTTLAMDREQLLAEIRALQARRANPASDDAHPEKESARRLAHVEHQRILDQARTLLLGEEQEVRRLLQSALEDEPLEARLLPFLIPFLERRYLARLTVEVLEKHARGREGLLIDALLDTRQSPTVRRRIPRVLREFVTERACQGLLAGLDDPNFGVRYHCAQALFAIVGKDQRLAPTRDKIFALVSREAAVSAQEWERALHHDESDTLSTEPPLQRGRPAARLEYVFMLLCTILDPEPLELCLKAVASGDRALRGTALEYLENVLPNHVYAALAKQVLVGTTTPPPSGKRKAPEQLVQELHQSVSNLRLDLNDVSDDKRQR